MAIPATTFHSRLVYQGSFFRLLILLSLLSSPCFFLDTHPAVIGANASPVRKLLQEAEFACASWSTQCQANPNGTFSLSCDNGDVGALQSSHYFYHGTFSAQLKFPAGYSGGIIFAFYLIDTVTTSNKDVNHAEIDAEFYGQVNSSEIMLATNVFCGGNQSLAQHKLLFDVGDGFHTYAISWSNTSIVWWVDGAPIRVLQRGGEGTTPAMWPQRPVQVALTVWDGSSFTTLKADYSNGPVTLLARNLVASGCSSSSATTYDQSCVSNDNSLLPWNVSPTSQQLSAASQVSETTADYGWDQA